MTISNQQRFRFYADDGSESTATALAAQNENIVVDVTSGNVQIALRAGIQETEASGNFGNPFRVEYSRNGGSYVLLTTSTSYVQSFNSTHLTDDGNTTERLTGGSGTFNAGKVTEDGTSAGVSLGGSNRTEILATLKLVSADLRDGDTLDFHVYQIGGTAVFTVVPRILVARNPDARFFGMFFDRI